MSTAALEEQGARIRLYGPASQSTTVYALHTRGTQYVSIQELANLFNCRLYENTTHGKIEIYPEQRRIKVTRDNPFVVIDEAIFQLRHDVLGIRGTLYVPIREFLPLLDHHQRPHRLASGPREYERLGSSSPTQLRFWCHTFSSSMNVDYN